METGQEDISLDDLVLSRPLVPTRDCLKPSVLPKPGIAPRWNATNIPEDILTIIFADVRNCTSELYSPLSQTQTTVITHVCHRWRQVALDCATLWICVTSSQAYQEIVTYLERSKGVPLDAYISLGGTRDTRCALILGELPRVRRLTVHTSQIADFADDVKILFGKPTVQLQEVHFTSSDPYDSPIPVLQTSHQSLRSLRLECCFFPWDCAIFQGLTHLCLRNIPWNHEPNLSEYRAILALCPNLRELSLLRAGPRDMHLHPSNAPIITLRSLRILEIQMSTYWWLEFSAMLSVPPNVCFTITLRGYYHHSAANIIPKYLTAIICPSDSMLSITSPSYSVAISQGPPSSDRGILLHWSSGQVHTADFFHLIATFVSSPTWAMPSVVNLAFDSYLSPLYGEMNKWTDVLDAMPNVRQLDITLKRCTSHPEKGLPEALASLHTSDTGQTRFRVPKLFRLVLTGFDFSNLSEVYGSCFQSRQELSPLHTLVLEKCSNFDEECLAKHVFQVIIH
ncbi:hypothetical protein BD410DRAFT_782807 [Rickenella mellea]|uniref:Uncharacterized protein n=1 Tax=Rickenella mellea TaxID=50990 RepID=A0A4Y7QKS4_9AGAM|nr:hypothetical protein BD410DRAFT_782807 [Rickenella mellea]